jgi:uncharacterized membrane protein HdeD (DUF308 family)
MLDRMVRYWWVHAIRGVLAILFGVAAFVWPVLTLVALVALFGAWAFVDGIFALMTAVKCAGQPRWWAPLMEGLTGILVGVLVFFWPEISAVALVYVIAVWAIITGFFEIITAIRLREEIQGEWLLALTGVLSVALGVLLAIAPGAGALGLVWAIGGFAMVYGILLIALAFRLRSLGQQFQTRAPA